MKNKFLIIVLTFILSLPMSALAVDDLSIGEQSTTVPIETIADDSNIVENKMDEDVIQDVNKEINSTNESNYKYPISKRKLIKKFLYAMFGVIISSISIFVGLTVYNKVRNKFANYHVSKDGNEPSLKVPDTLHDAIKSFINKTNWK